ncbi:hypothetical protein WDV93_13140 [Pantoea ananatis]
MSTCQDTAIRASFFDFAAVANEPEAILSQARYIEDGLLILREGRVVGLHPGVMSAAVRQQSALSICAVS